MFVILAILTNKQERKEIERFLQKNSYENVDTRYSLLGSSLPFAMEEKIDFYKESVKIHQALELMYDDHSRDVFYSNLRAYMTHNYDDTLISEGMVQYFDVKIPFSKGYAYFIDCGAFTGDSLQELLKYHDCHTYIAFEPDLNNFKILAKHVEERQDKIKQAFLYPCAIVLILQ